MPNLQFGEPMPNAVKLILAKPADDSWDSVDRIKKGVRDANAKQFAPEPKVEPESKVFTPKVGKPEETAPEPAKPKVETEPAPRNRAEKQKLRRDIKRLQPFEQDPALQAKVKEWLTKVDAARIDEDDKADLQDVVTRFVLDFAKKPDQARWNSPILEQGRGKDFSDALEREIRDYLRDNPPRLGEQQPEGDEDQYVAPANQRVKSLNYILTKDPQIVAVGAVRQHADAIANFLKTRKAEINDPKRVYQLYPASATRPKTQMGELYVFITTGADAKMIVNDFTQQPVVVRQWKLDRDTMSSPEPFAQVSFAEFGDIMNDLDVRHTLNGVWNTIKDELDLTPQEGLEPIAQMSSAIPLDYFRFFSPQQKEWPWYMSSDSPEIYVLLGSHAPYENFKSVMEKFKQKNMFYRTMFYSSLADKYMNDEPRTFTPANALILEGKQAFDPPGDFGTPKFADVLQRKLTKTVEGGDVKKVAQFLQEYDFSSGIDVAEFDKDAKAIKEPDLAESLVRQHVLVQQANDLHWDPDLMREAEMIEIPEPLRRSPQDRFTNQHGIFQRIATELLGNPTKKPGRVVNGYLVVGDLLVHYSADFRRVIIWGSRTKSVAVQPNLLKDWFDWIGVVNTDYL